MKKLFLAFSLLAFHTQMIPVATWSKGIHTPLGTINIARTVDEKLVATVIAIAAASGIAYQMSWHKTYATKSQELFDKVNCLLDKLFRENPKKIDAQNLLVNFDMEELSDILVYTHWLNNSYNQWLLVWNWMPSQKRAFEQMMAVLGAVFYLHLLNEYFGILEKSDNQIEAETLLLKLCRYHYTSVSSYPLVYAAKQIRQFINMRKDHKFDNMPLMNSLFKNTSCELLNLLAVIESSQDYVQEKQSEITHNLLHDIYNKQGFSYYPGL